MKTVIAYCVNEINKVLIGLKSSTRNNFGVLEDSLYIYYSIKCCHLYWLTVLFRFCAYMLQHESHQGHSQSTCIHPDMTLCPPLLLPSDTDAINSVDSVVTCSSMNTEHYIQDVSSRLRLSVEKQNQKCLFEIKEKKKALKRIQDEKIQAKKVGIGVFV